MNIYKPSYWIKANVDDQLEYTNFEQLNGQRLGFEKIPVGLDVAISIRNITKVDNVLSLFNNTSKIKI